MRMDSKTGGIGESKGLEVEQWNGKWNVFCHYKLEGAGGKGGGGILGMEAGQLRGSLGIGGMGKRTQTFLPNNFGF